MRLPTYDELIEEQRDVMDVPLDQDLFVAGPPGSGKTILAVERARAAMAFRQDVLMITYNRMLQRLMSLLDAPLSRTMDAHVWGDYEDRTGQRAPTFDGGGFRPFRWRRMLDTLDGHDEAGFRQGHLVVDEGQDLPRQFFEYARLHIAPVLTVFADEHQAIGARGSTLRQIMDSGRLPQPVLLSENHRNTQAIALLAERFQRGLVPHARVRRVGGSMPRLTPMLDLNATATLVGRWFENRGGTIGVVVVSNSYGAEVKSALAGVLPQGTRLQHYTNKKKNEGWIDVRRPGITVLNVESVKGQEFDAVFLLEIDRLLPCTEPVRRRKMYMLCTRARDRLFLVPRRRLSRDALAELPVALIDRR